MQEEKSNIFERILKIIDYYHIKNINTLAKEYLGYDSSEKINRLKDAKKKPSVDILEDFLNKFENLDINWLLTGRGSMLRADASVAHPVQAQDEGIPLIPASAIAGAFSGGQRLPNPECERYVVPAFQDAEFLIAVTGFSMSPTYNSGDIVACKRLPPDTFFQWNKVYLLNTEQGPLIKRVRQGTSSDTITIHSDNPSYDPFELSRSSISHIALVVGVIRIE